MSPIWLKAELRLLLTAVSVFLALWASVDTLEGQTLGLKRQIPGSGSFSCPHLQEPPPPTQEERMEAGRLGSAADQALILGDLERARDLLARATELDPFSSDLAYRHARVLEDLGAWEEAVEAFCRVQALGSGTDGIRDAPTRLMAILDRERGQIPQDALDAFKEGISEADAGRDQRAFIAFQQASQQAPSWPDAIYNRGIIQARIGRVEEATADLQRYLDLSPEAEDAILVSQRIGQLRSLASLPRPTGALSLGILFPGGGQFYSGRTWQGLSVLSLAAGAIAAGLLIEEVTVKCVGGVSGGGDCPPDRVVGESSDTPYLAYGLAAAGAVSFLGALEAFFKARRRRAEELGALIAFDLGNSRILIPTVASRGSRLQLQLVQVTF